MDTFGGGRFKPCENGAGEKVPKVAGKTACDRRVRGTPGGGGPLRFSSSQQSVLHYGLFSAAAAAVAVDCVYIHLPLLSSRQL